VPAPRKLTDAEVVEIRERVDAGEQQTVLAAEFGVNRKTIRRRLHALAVAEQVKADRIAAARLKRRVAVQRFKLEQRELRRGGGAVETAVTETPDGRTRSKSDRDIWLDRRKNLAGRVLAEARGDVYIQTPDGKNRRWVERAKVDGMFEDGWILVD
jgi:hypothetical protein